MPAPRIIAKDYSDAIRFARETLGLRPTHVRVVSNAASLAGHGYTLHLAPGWEKNHAVHFLKSRLRYKRNIEIVDHAAEVKKESTRKIETTALKCQFCSLPDSECACTFNCSECDSEMVKDEIAGGHLCPQCDTPRRASSAPEEEPTEMHHCDGCGEDYNILEESHIGHQTETSINLTGKSERIMPPGWRDMGHITEETDAETGTPEPSEDAEGSEKPVQRRRRRCKTCGILVEPDEVEAHAAEHEAE